MRLPNIVCLTGIDGCGKTTHAALLADHLDANIDAHNASVQFASQEIDAPCLRRSFPNYDSPTGVLIKEHLRGNWLAEWCPGYPTPPLARMGTAGLNATVLQALMAVNRLEVTDEIERAVITEGRSVVLSRYWSDSIAYGMADGLDYDWLMRIHTRLPKAHHVLIDISVEESFKRRPERMDAYESDKERLRRARINYLHLFERNGVDMSYWQNGLGTGLSGDDQGYRTSPSGWAIVNGLGEVSEVQARIRKALEL